MTKPKPRFRIHIGQTLRLEAAGEETIAQILAFCGAIEPSEHVIELVRFDVARVQGFFEVEDLAPLTSERAAALRRLRSTLANLNLNQKLGPVQRGQVVQRLLRFEPPPDLSNPLNCLTYLEQMLGVWVIYANEGKTPLPRVLAPAVRKAASLIFDIDDFSTGALFNHLVVTLAHAPAPPPEPDPIDAIEYCRDRLIEAADRAREDVPKAGPVGQRAVHITVSYLGPRYHQLTGRWPGFNRNVATFERDPFYRFTSSILEAAGHPQSFETLHRAIRLYCQARNKRIKVQRPDS